MCVSMIQALCSLLVAAVFSNSISLSHFLFGWLAPTVYSHSHPHNVMDGVVLSIAVDGHITDVVRASLCVS